MQDFLVFRRMLTPLIIQVLFWIGVIGCVIGGIGGILSAGNSSIRLSYGLALLIFGPIAVRIFCELLILFFRMNETLTDISNKLIAGTETIKEEFSKGEGSLQSSNPEPPKETPEVKPSKLQFKTKEEYEKWKAERMKQNEEKDKS